MNKSIEDALRYISNEIKQNPDAERSKLIDEAAQKYDLNPMQTQFLFNKFILDK